MAKGKKDGPSQAAVHLVRHSLHKLGSTVEDIAASQGVTVATVKRSISLVDSYRLTNTPELLNTALIDTMLGRKKKLDKALDESLGAEIIGREGTRVPDHKVRLQAVGKMVDMARVLQPKAPGRPINLNVNQQHGVHQAVIAGETAYVGFEERLRKARIKIDDYNKLPPPESVASPLGEDEIALEEDQEEVVNANTGNSSG